ncbi:MAG: AI-2E family transporter [Alphaproteobacteria bacterium HGW-Alphaproteobacteria-2]|nr:MAG: AI-2E family transporter [Alphaproteobacteria bacterium HGW-Alphaproteobacteria-2]
MALPVREQMKYWGVATAVFLLLLWFLGDVILPFLVGGAVAYFLDPVADRLERAGLSRAAATVLISLGAALVALLAALLLVPVAVRQLADLVAAAPEISRSVQGFLTERFPSLIDEGSTLRQSLDGVAETIRAKGGALINGLLSSALNVINALVFIVVVPVVAFYLLLDWDRMIARIDELLPRDHAPVIRRLAGEIDRVLAGFVRGQLSVCMILGAAYALALIVVGLKYGLVVGLVAGLLTFIPYVGSIVGGTLAIGLALFQFWGEPWMIGIVGAIFVAGQMVEGNFLTPKLVGGSVGLHPVWLLFALSAFGTLFGFVGMLVAVPMAAMLGVLARFAVEQYREGRLYRGLVPPDDD